MTGVTKNELARLVGEDRPFQSIFWKIQRVMWIAFALIVLVALAGWMGSGGPFSRSSKQFGGVTIDYPHSWRLAASDRLAIRPAAARPQTISIDAAITDSFRIEHITPEPAGSEVRGGRLIYRFDEDAQLVSFTLKPTAFSWRKSYILRAGNGPAIALHFGIWP